MMISTSRHKRRADKHGSHVDGHQDASHSQQASGSGPDHEGNALHGTESPNCFSPSHDPFGCGRKVGESGHRYSGKSEPVEHTACRSKHAQDQPAGEFLSRGEMSHKCEPGRT